MSTIEIDQTGVDALRMFALDRVGGNLADGMIDDARRLAPVDTGAMKASGRVIRMAPEMWRIIFGEGLPDGRAVYQELGTRYMPPQPYIRPAVYRERGL